MITQPHKKLATAVFILIWSAIILAAFYITQRPLFFQVIAGTINTLWAIILLFILLVDSAYLGTFFLKKIVLQINPNERLILGMGFGLGTLGLFGYGLAAAGLANPVVLLLSLFGVLIWGFISKAHHQLRNDFHSILDTFQDKSEIPAWLPVIIGATLILIFLFALLPPAEGFDGLLYHLALPERLLADKGIVLYDNPSFWFPALIEGDYIWALGLGSERTAQLIHWSFTILILLLVWEWTHKTFEGKSAWWALAILISMPSLPWVASWAYNDLALSFFGLAALYAVWKWSMTDTRRWLVVSGIFSGMAMSVKYTSFVLPVFCVLIIFVLGRTMSERVRLIILFSLIALLVASPWYIRNWIMMKNPFYPFAFGGRFWDFFLTDWQTNSGTGIGWDFKEILLIPLNITLGARDQTFYDGRIGPLFLLTLPLTLWVLWRKRFAPASEKKMLYILFIFALINYAVWAFGVIQTISLWQARYLWQGLIPLAIPIGVGIGRLSDLDHPRLKISFMINLIIGLVIAIALLDNTLSLIFRRPFAYALGIESRQEYFERIQPDYSSALKLAGTTPQNSYVYFLFEPRSYNMPHNVQPDVHNSNLMHDYYLYNSPTAIIANWKAKGYTHILVNFSGSNFFTTRQGESVESYLNDVLKYLKLESELNGYALYTIP